MCGRFILTLDFDTIQDILAGRFHLAPQTLSTEPRYNIAPTQQVLTLIRPPKDQPRRLGFMKWGLVPTWSNDESIGSKMINARSETADEKPSFKESFASKRCLIFANGFYEWKRHQGKKTPYLIGVTSHELFSMAGLYTVRHQKDGTKKGTCTILTTTPNKLMGSIHDRMPVILDFEREQKWLEPDATVDQLKALLTPYNSEDMYAYPVSNYVNATSHEGPECIQKVTAFENTSLDFL